MRTTYSLAVLALCLSTLAFSQDGPTLTTSDYDRAVSQLYSNAYQLIDGTRSVSWQDDGRLMYQYFTSEGREFRLFDPESKTTLTAATREELEEKASIVNEENNFSWLERPSPDGKYTVFIKGWNLWLKEVATGDERPLTTDGIEDFGYATDNAGWLHSDRAIVRWSPDSKKIATFQQDQRHLNDMYLVKTKVGAPELMKWKYPLPEDSAIIKIHRVIIDITEEPKVIRLDMPADDRRSTYLDDIAWRGQLADVAWSDDSQQLAFVSSSRDHKRATVRMADASTGEVTELFEEIVDTQFESGQDAFSWRYSSSNDEIIWYSERSDWGHLYLYDAKTGIMKNEITQGDWVVREVVHVDHDNRRIYFLASGKEEGANPYFRSLYSVNFSGRNLKLLTPEPGDHSITFSPSKEYFLDSYSQPGVPHVYKVRDTRGRTITELGNADISRLEATEWKPPTEFSVKSADEQWDLYGLMYTPKNMDPSKQYPVVVYIYPGPQGGSVGYWGFTFRGDNQALAELGFVVVQLEGSCNPGRSKSFHDACYGNMGENTLPDQISALEQLSEKHGFLDLDRVGIWGHSGGGFATASAMLKHPDFFKVGVSQSGNHDNRNYEDDWGERYIGLQAFDENGVSNFEGQANQMYANDLKGKLMIIHGGMDDNVPPYNSYLVADALIKANKDFDFLLLPNARHGYGRDNYYIMRRRWDYFVRHLLDGTPPREYKVQFDSDPRLD